MASEKPCGGCTHEWSQHGCEALRDLVDDDPRDALLAECEEALRHIVEWTEGVPEANCEAAHGIAEAVLAKLRARSGAKA